MRNEKLFVYDRAPARVGGATPVVVLWRPDGRYKMLTYQLEGSYVRDTDKLETEIYRCMSKAGEFREVCVERVSEKMEDFLSANRDQIDIALSVMQEHNVNRVESIMKDVLSLSPKERSDLLIAILDIL